MRKLFLLTLIFGIISCEEDTSNVLNQTSVLFNKSVQNLPVSNTVQSFVEVEIGVTTKSNVDRTFNFVVDPSSTATPNMYTLESNSVVIPAGQYTAKVKVTGNFENVPVTGLSTLVLKLASDQTNMPGKDSHTISIYRFCLTNLAGNYSVTTNYQVHDFLPSFSTHTMTTQITAQSAENTYRVADFSGGLYSVGPYASAYGTGAASAANLIDLIFTVNCDRIVWTGQSDPWGAIIQTPGGLNTYNATTGVLTISWTAAGYGERGVSVYTKL